ncbi:MAG TPA: GGDEF domain-containing protein [Bryobacteraceae bacterium]|nr:GGDEF domain-containing protein [Bryobacteraceae bacterium]
MQAAKTEQYIEKHGEKDGEQDRDVRVAFTAVDSYLSALAGIAAVVSGVFPDVGSEHARKLIRLRNRLAFEADVPGLIESRETLLNELMAFSEKARGLYISRTEAVHKSLELLAELGNSLAPQNNENFKTLLQLAARVEALGATNEAAALRQAIEALGKEREAVIGGLENQVRLLETRLKTTDMLASIDPLTGVGSRGELEHQLSARVKVNKAFCLLLFDIDNFHAVNQQYGNLCGDELLKQVAARLSNQIRTRDFVCRWGGDEFVVIMECDPDNAKRRCKQISQWLSGPYRVKVEAREFRVDMQMSSDLTERRPNEESHDVLLRLGELRPA